MSVGDQKDVDEAGRVKVPQENTIFSHVGSYDSRDGKASRLVHHWNIQRTAELTEFPFGVYFVAVPQCNNNPVQVKMHFQLKV